MPKYTMFSANGKPSRSTSKIWLGIFENGAGKIFNLAIPEIQRSVDISSTSRLGQNDRVVVGIFNCRHADLISSSVIDQSKQSFDSLANKALITNHLAAVGFVRTLSEIGVNLSGITLGRLNILRSGMSYLEQMLSAGNSSNGNVGAHEIIGAVVKIN